MELLEVDVQLEAKHILDQEHIERLLEVELELDEMDEIQRADVIEEMDELEYVDIEDEDDEVDMSVDEQLVIDEEYDDDILLELDTRLRIIIEVDDEELGIEPIELANLELTDVNELSSYAIQKMEVMVLKEQSEEMNVMSVIDIVYINSHLIENLYQFNGNFL